MPLRGTSSSSSIARYQRRSLGMREGGQVSPLDAACYSLWLFLLLWYQHAELPPVTSS